MAPEDTIKTSLLFLKSQAISSLMEERILCLTTPLEFASTAEPIFITIRLYEFTLRIFKT
jgi:hypothetical protein